MRPIELRWIHLTAALALALAFAAGTLMPARAAAGKQEQGLHAVSRVATAAAAADDSGSSAVTAQQAYAGLLQVQGTNRFETAAAFARGFWTFEETIVVYVANGRSFPDALGAGGGTPIDPLGPILLTDRDALPKPTVDVIRELSPCYIVTLGGDSAISQAVRSQLDQLASYDEEFCQPA